MVVTSSSLLFALTTALYIALSLWHLGIHRGRRGSLFLTLGFVGTATWAASNLSENPFANVVGETVRNLAWCGYLAFVVRHDRSLVSQAWISRAPVALMAVALVRSAILLFWTTSDAWIVLAVLASSLAFCVGALVLLYSLFLAAHHAASGFKLLLFALATSWAFDLNAYASVLLRFNVPAMLTDGRALVALLLAPLFGIAVRRKEHWSLSPSRGLAFQSLSLVAIGAYLVVLSTIAGARPWLGGTVQVLAGSVLVVAVFIVTFAFLISAQFRSILKVSLSKHLFKHRYDYRTEWLRFNATINSGSLTGLSPEQRAIKALTDIMDAAGGLFFLSGTGHRLERVADFEWPDHVPMQHDIVLADAMIDAILNESRVMISPRYRDKEDVTLFPEGLSTDGSIWLVAPLVRIGSLVGVVALGRPRVSRRLDWEDFDLLKVLGQQIATYIADARRQAESEEARQFEEFNRRFAFIIHDIKNVVSQLSLVVANAEEHGENPRFRADMMSTIGNAVGKMTTLLSRLSLDRPASEVVLNDVDTGQLLKQIADARRPQHPVLVTDGEPLTVISNAEMLGTAIDHLVQNAIEASEPKEPIVLSACRKGEHGLISVVDHGAGMSADFIRRQLFKPFASTKAAGFGIGAGEAQSLIRQMGGELEVQSVPGSGTSFVIRLMLGRTSGESGRAG